VQPQQSRVDEDARELIAAATDESTPPESPQTTCDAPTCVRTFDSSLSMKAPGVHSATAWQTSNRKFEISSPPRGVCDTSGWNCTPWIGRLVCRIAAIGTEVLHAVTTYPGGGLSTWSP
jgi:hypothetical protein